MCPKTVDSPFLAENARRKRSLISPVAQISGRARLVHLDMRLTVTDDTAVRCHHRGQRKAIGGSAGRHPERRALAPEQQGKRLIQIAAQRVIVIRRIGRIGSEHRAPHGGMNGGGIVGHELHGHIA